jgi:hypothetical protein
MECAGREVGEVTSRYSKVRTKSKECMRRTRSEKD